MIPEGLLELKTLDRLAVHLWMRYQVDVQRTVSVIQGVTFANGVAHPRITDGLEAQKVPRLIGETGH